MLLLLLLLCQRLKKRRNENNFTDKKSDLGLSISRARRSTLNTRWTHLIDYFQVVKTGSQRI